MRFNVLRGAALAAALTFGITGTACARLSAVMAAPDQGEQHAKDRATSLFNQFVSGKLDRSDFTPEMDKAMAPELVKQISPQFATLGEIKNLTLLTKDNVQGGTNYVFTATFTGGDHKIQIFITGDNKVGGYRVLP